MSDYFIAVIPTARYGDAETGYFRGPVLPPSWDWVRETGLIYTVWPLGRTAHPRVWVHIVGAYYHPPSEQALVGVFGRDVIIDRLRERASRVVGSIADVRRLASNDSVKMLWPDDRPRLTGPDGEDLGPDPGAPRYAWRRTMAGFDYRRGTVA